MKLLFFIQKLVPKKSVFKTQKGVVILEYALLLVACVALAFLIKEIVQIGSSPEESGWLVRKWMDILKVIGEDI